MPLIPAARLAQFSEEILVGAGVAPHKAKIVADCLLYANLRGVDSHGIQLLPFYIEQILAGEMDPAAEGEVLSEFGSCLHFDAQNGIGQWAAEQCSAHAVRIAK